MGRKKVNSHFKYIYSRPVVNSMPQVGYWIRQYGVRKVAKLVDTSPSNLSMMLNGVHAISEELAVRIIEQWEKLK